MYIGGYWLRLDGMIQNGITMVGHGQDESWYLIKYIFDVSGKAGGGLK